jgi:lysine-arginine-ornithine-binding protein
MRTLISGLALIGAMALGTAAAAQETLRFGVDPTFAPFEYKNPDGSLTGFNIEVGEAICAQLGRQCEWVESSWDGIIPGLMAGNFDAILSSMSITPTRDEILDFTNPYQGSGSRFVVPVGTQIDDAHGGMDGMRIGVQRGTVDHDYLRAYYPDADIRAYPGMDEVWLDMTAGRLDAVLVGSTNANQFFATEGGKGFEQTGALHDEPEIYGVGAGIAVPPESEALLADLNSALAAIIENGEMKRINDEYFDYDITGGLLD